MSNFVWYLVCFETLYSILPSEGPIRDTPSNILNLNNLSTKRPILGCKLSLDRASQDLKICLKIPQRVFFIVFLGPPLGVLGPIQLKKWNNF